jgi:RNA polymerase sigma factor (sigma-70 family)
MPISASEEILLTLRARAGDQKARNRLIESHWFLCGKLAAKYRRKLPFEDAMSEAMAALILAVDRFDPANGRLKTFAWKWMHGAISKAELKNYSIGPLGGTKQRHLFFNLNKEKAKRGISLVASEGEAASIARTLSTDRFNLTAKDVFVAESRLAHVGDRSLDAVIGKDEDGHDLTLHDVFADEGPGPDDILIKY